jgi:hypothetical protein
MLGKQRSLKKSKRFSWSQLKRIKSDKPEEVTSEIPLLYYEIPVLYYDDYVQVFAEAVSGDRLKRYPDDYGEYDTDGDSCFQLSSSGMICSVGDSRSTIILGAYRTIWPGQDVDIDIDRPVRDKCEEYLVGVQKGADVQFANWTIDGGLVNGTNTIRIWLDNCVLNMSEKSDVHVANNSVSNCTFQGKQKTKGCAIGAIDISPQTDMEIIVHCGITGTGVGVIYDDGPLHLPGGSRCQPLQSITVLLAHHRRLMK